MALQPQGYRKVRNINRRGLRSTQPLANTTLIGTLYYVTDEEVIERSNGTIWESYSAGGMALRFSEVLPVNTFESDLNRGKTNGSFTIPGNFPIEMIGSPVIINQDLGPGIDVSMVQFTGEIISEKLIEVIWQAPFGAPAKSKINYVIGARK